MTSVSQTPTSPLAVEYDEANIIYKTFSVVVLHKWLLQTTPRNHCLEIAFYTSVTGFKEAQDFVRELKQYFEANDPTNPWRDHLYEFLDMKRYAIIDDLKAPSVTTEHFILVDQPNIFVETYREYNHQVISFNIQQKYQCIAHAPIWLDQIQNTLSQHTQLIEPGTAIPFQYCSIRNVL